MARFLPISDVTEILAVSAAQVRTLIYNGELRAIQVGGRNQWRIEDTALEEYIAARYKETAALVENKDARERQND